MRPRGRARLVVAAVAVLVSLAIVVVATGVARAYRIPAAGMEPTLLCAGSTPGCSGSSSDRILVVEYVFGGPSRGDIVAFRAPPAEELACGGSGGVRIKRVVGLPDERWEERGGFVYVDGKRLREPYIPPERRDARTTAPRSIPADAYLVLGDNRESSCDSRDWGPLPRRDVIGRVVAIWWPPGRISFP